MLIAKLLLLTAMTCSYSIRTPAIDNCPADYEIRAGIEAEVNNSRHEMKFSLRGLYEQEIGLHGWGHDFNLEYTKQDKMLEKLTNHKFAYFREVTSYCREVKDISLQTIDTGYKLNKWLRIGYSVAFEHFDETNLLYYAQAKTDWISFELRIKPDKIINTFKLGTKIPLKKNFYFYPFMKYVNIDGDKDYWAKGEVGYKL